MCQRKPQSLPPEGLCLGRQRAGARGGDPLAPGTHTPPPSTAPPARWRPGLQDPLLINSDKINSGQSVSGEQAGRTVVWLGPGSGRPQAAGGTKWRLSKNKRRPSQEPRNPKFSPWGETGCVCSARAPVRPSISRKCQPNQTGPPRPPQPQALIPRSSPLSRVG